MDEPTEDKFSSQLLSQSKPDRDERKTETAILSSNQVIRRLEHARPATGTVSFGRHELLLVIRGIIERLMLADDTEVILGRTDPLTRYLPDVDLTPYGALDRGVSREHARLHIEDGRLYITDLGSTNGTFLGGKRLEPQKPTLIGKGDELLLGRLGVQVLFR